MSALATGAPAGPLSAGGQAGAARTAGPTPGPQAVALESASVAAGLRSAAPMLAGSCATRPLEFADILRRLADKRDLTRGGSRLGLGPAGRWRGRRGEDRRLPHGS